MSEKELIQDASIERVGTETEIANEATEHIVIEATNNEEPIEKTPENETQSAVDAVETENAAVENTPDAGLAMEENLSTEENTSSLFLLTKEELVEKLRETVKNTQKDVKTEVALIKQLFYKKIKDEQIELKEAWEKIAENAEKTFTPAIDALEIEIKNILAEYRSEKAKQNALNEAQREENLQIKLAVIEELKAVIENPEEVNAAYPRFRELQQKWRETGPVPLSRSTEIFKTYNLYVENFYDLLKINNDLRDYDFKKNLEQKLNLIAQAEALSLQENALSAFRKLQDLHEEWKQIGPVMRD